MTQKLYLEVAFKDNHWAEAVNNAFSGMKITLQQFRRAFHWSETLGKKEFDNFFRCGDADYDYTEDVASIKFDIVTEDKIKSWDNYETAYIQLYGTQKDYGNWFIV